MDDGPKRNKKENEANRIGFGGCRERFYCKLQAKIGGTDTVLLSRLCGAIVIRERVCGAQDASLPQVCRRNGPQGVLLQAVSETIHESGPIERALVQ